MVPVFEPSPRPPTVLVVDDDGLIRAALNGWLSETYTVLEAADGEAALELVERADPDVVLMDVMMPGPDGIETCRRIKERDRGAYRPVLMLTASDDQERRNAGLAAGADDFLSKPIDRQELLLRVSAFHRLRQQDTQIRLQVEELRRLDQRKEDLVALVTHDLMNTLSGLLLRMESIQYSGAACKPEDLEGLRTTAGNMRETIEDMQRIKQFEEGVLQLSVSAFGLADLVGGAIHLVEPLARARAVTIVPRLDPRASLVGDEALLRRSVFNLLEYAVKGSPRGGAVELRARAVGANAEVELHDRSAPMATEARERLFDKFAVVDGPPAPGRPRGHRLGLCLVELVARAHGGEVSVDARAEGGFAYRLVLPLKPA